MKRVYIAAIAALLMLATVAGADDSVYDVSIKGAWSTLGNGERYLKLDFDADTFTMHYKDGGPEKVETGMYQQDSKSIFLIITHGNKQIQKQISYEVVDQYTIRVTLDGKKYMLERTE